MYSMIIMICSVRVRILTKEEQLQYSGANPRPLSYVHFYFHDNKSVILICHLVSTCTVVD